MTFQHDIAGGSGDLVITSVQSPDYVPGVSGWQIRQDGTAEFNNGTFRTGISAGGSLTISGDAITISGLAGPGGTDTTDLSIAPVDLPPGANAPYLAITATDVTAGTSVALYIGAAGIVAGAPVTALDPGAPTPTPETPHAITMDAGWTARSGFQAPSYQLLPDGNLQLSGSATHAALTAGATNLNSSNPIPAGWRPATTHYYRAEDTRRPGVEITNTGVIVAESAGGQTIIELDGIVAMT